MRGESEGFPLKMPLFHGTEQRQAMRGNTRFSNDELVVITPAGLVGAQPMRGESEGSPLSNPPFSGRGRSSAIAMRSKPGNLR
jgi:hypothetical protein